MSHPNGLKYPKSHPDYRDNGHETEPAEVVYGGKYGITARQAITSALQHSLGVETGLMAFRERLAALEQRAASAQPERPWHSFSDFVSSIRNAALGNGADKRLMESRAASGLTGSEAPDAGGFIIPGEFSSVLMQMVYAASIASRALRIPAKRSRSIAFAAIDETSRASGSRWGGVSSTWDIEADTMTPTKPKFRRLELSLKRLLTLIYATDELSEDASALSVFLSSAFVAEAAFQLDDVIVNGNGAGVPLGILNSPGLITVAKQGGQTAGTIVGQNLLDMFGRLLPECLPGAVWLVSTDVLAELYAAYVGSATASASATQFLTAPDADAPYGRLLTRPLLPVEQTAALGTVGDIILVDMTKYVVYERPLDLQMSMDVRFVNGEAVYRMRYRVDGAPIIKSQITPKNGSATKSGFIALATRG